ncbi:MAG: hypothetical protein LYZ70_00940, partial [Nitrososphaerales archaeon]|nr:hypothetical protein [Nitrososphaerales archaeon]
EIVQRVQSASKIFAKDRITLNPDCGFASGRPWPVVTREIAYQKLRAQTEAAQRLRRLYA